MSTHKDDPPSPRSADAGGKVDSAPVVVQNEGKKDETASAATATQVNQQSQQPPTDDDSDDNEDLPESVQVVSPYERLTLPWTEEEVPEELPKSLAIFIHHQQGIDIEFQLSVQVQLAIQLYNEFIHRHDDFCDRNMNLGPFFIDDENDEEGTASAGILFECTYESIKRDVATEETPSPDVAVNNEAANPPTSDDVPPTEEVSQLPLPPPVDHAITLDCMWRRIFLEGEDGEWINCNTDMVKAACKNVGSVGSVAPAVPSSVASTPHTGKSFTDEESPDTSSEEEEEEEDNEEEEEDPATVIDMFIVCDNISHFIPNRDTLLRELQYLFEKEHIALKLHMVAPSIAVQLKKEWPKFDHPYLTLLETDACLSPSRLIVSNTGPLIESYMSFNKCVPVVLFRYPERDCSMDDFARSVKFQEIPKSAGLLSLMASLPKATDPAREDG